MMNNIKPSTNQYQDSYPIKNPKENGQTTDNTVKLPSTEKSESIDTKNLIKQGTIKCQTCESRRYQDGSNDPGVSFKSPGYISPESSAAVVMSHEKEHVSNEKAKAQSEKKEIVNQNVQIFTAICPECGKAYAAGGKTTTTTRTVPTATEAKDPTRGEKFDKKV